MSHYIDISRKIHPQMAVYPNNPEITIKKIQSAGAGKNALSWIGMGTHTGTHIDAPSHIKEGDKGALTYPLQQLCGPVELIDLTHLQEVITAQDIPETKEDRVIFKTRNSQGDPNEFKDNFIALNDSAAEQCVDRGLKLVGLDALSIRKRNMKNQVHETLINNQIIIVEGLWLADIEAGTYNLICLPLKLDLDGAPARAVLTKEKTQ